MTRPAAALALLGTFLAGVAAMAWWLTRWHDDRPYLDEPVPAIALGRPMEIRWSPGEWTRGILGGIGWDPKWQAYRISLTGVTRSDDDEPGGGWES